MHTCVCRRNPEWLTLFNKEGLGYVCVYMCVHMCVHLKDTTDEVQQHQSAPVGTFCMAQSDDGFAHVNATA